MSAAIRFYGTGILLSVALAGVAVARPSWLGVLGVEGPPEQNPTSYVISGPGELCQVVAARIRARMQIADRLRAGELDLFEAAAWFRHINEEPAKYADSAWRLRPGDSDEEKQCRDVILWVRGYFSVSVTNSELELFITRLEGQLSDRLCESGRIDLPSWR